jgi:hypothetical protein
VRPLFIAIALAATARADTSVPPRAATTSGGDACHTRTQAPLERALFRYCSRQPNVDLRGCGEVRRALLRCADERLSVHFSDDQDARDPVAEAHVELPDAKRLTYSWMVDFSHEGGDWRVTSFHYGYNDCDGP